MIWFFIDHLTFRDAPKKKGEDESIVSKLETFQPDPFDTTTITTENIENVQSLPRKTCSGTLIPNTDDGEEGEGIDCTPEERSKDSSGIILSQRSIVRYFAMTFVFALLWLYVVEAL